MSRVRGGQLFAILFLLRMFTFLCTPLPFSSVQIGGSLLSTAVQALLVLPALALYDRGFQPVRPNRDKWVAVLYGLFFVYWGASALVRLWTVATGISFPITSMRLGAVLLAVCCLYAAKLGLRTLGRASAIVFGLFLLTLAVMLIGAFGKLQAENLLPDGNGGLLRAAWADLCDSGELPAAVILCGYAQTRRRHALFSMLLAKLAVITLVSVLGILVLGRLMDIADYPFFTLGSFSQPFAVQRADSLYLILFTMLGVVSVTTQILLASTMLHAVAPRCPHTVLIATAACLAGGVCLSLTGSATVHAAGIAIVLLTLLIPLILLIERSLHEKTTHSDRTDGAAVHGVQHHGGA